MTGLIDVLSAINIDRLTSFIFDAQLNPSHLTNPVSGSTPVPVMNVVTIHFDPLPTVIGAVILVALMVGFYFLKGAVTDGLITSNASLRKAAEAGWSLFLLLSLLVASAIFSYIGTLWVNLIVFGCVLAIDVLVLILFIVTFLAARASARIKNSQ